jgi:hypothetical protein
MKKTSNVAIWQLDHANGFRQCFPEIRGSAATSSLSDQVIGRGNTLSVFMLAREFVQNKFLGQTADDM